MYNAYPSEYAPYIERSYAILHQVGRHRNASHMVRINRWAQGRGDDKTPKIRLGRPSET